MKYIQRCYSCPHIPKNITIPYEERLKIQIETLQDLIRDVDFPENPQSNDELKNAALYFNIRSMIVQLQRLQLKEVERMEKGEAG
jgi:hypothetical protein